MKKPNLASFIFGVGVLTLPAWRNGDDCTLVAAPSAAMVRALFFVVDCVMVVVFLLVFAVAALSLSDEKTLVASTGGRVRIEYFALNVCVTSLAGASDTSRPENYTVSITVVPMRMLMLT